DLTAMGKVIGGGLPVGAFGGRADVMDWLSPTGPVYQAGTLSGNPLALAAGLAQLRQLEEGDGYHRLEQLGAYFEQGVRKILKQTGRNLIFHRIGSMFCLYFTNAPVDNLADAQRSDLDSFKSFFHFCREGGVYFAPSQFEAGFLCLAHQEADIDRTLEVVSDALSKTVRKS
ncbi:MAG TPA: aminotransferase class III-fold pyridoxal phosphate-dependent enzyme, partial [Chthoniobacterales bacterium]|nr:aminotransferase class III-fold pyridoxal phosphate-dependent enzyme [Chthoniobacterales bacterium]